MDAIRHYNAQKGMIITNSTLTENAYEFAKSNGIKLWDRDTLIELMRKSKGREVAVTGDPKDVIDRMLEQTPVTVMEVCPNCGGELILRERRRGKYWVCSNFPKCWYTKSYEFPVSHTN
jgi:restriction system protein